jgi:hypothetical protein
MLIISEKKATAVPALFQNKILKMIHTKNGLRIILLPGTIPIWLPN